MAKLSDLIVTEKKQFQGFGGFWRGIMVAPLPATYTDKMYVSLVDIDPHTKFGPCEWPKGALSFVALGRTVLVVFDNHQNPWVVGIA